MSKIKTIAIGAAITAALSGLGFLCKTMWTTGQDVSALRGIMSQKSSEDKAQWRLLNELSSHKDSKDLETAVLRRIQEHIVLPFIIGKLEQPIVSEAPVHAKEYKDLLGKVETPKKALDTEQFIHHQMKKSK